MPDDGFPGLPRIALVFGDEADAAHVREAIEGHADIAYATAAVDFDAARLADAKVAAALVNLNGDDWLDTIEAGLDAAAITAVYNDPDISRGLEGWARARWLRHLVAKLRGSADVDPPRPIRVDALAAARPATQEPSRNEEAVVERPLSPQEIETMTADFVAVPQVASVQIGEATPQPTAIEPSADSAGLASAGAPVASREALPGDGPIEAMAAEAAPDPKRMPADDSGFDRDEDLNVDTEALSAMIDARLADSDSKSLDSPEVWRVVEGETVAAGRPEPLADHSSAAANSADVAAAPKADVAAQDDAAVLASLPSLDDWQLVDADAEPAPAAAPAAACDGDDAGPTLSDRFDGLELVPMETVAAAFHTEPIERWLQESEPSKAKAGVDGTAKVASTGGNG